MIRKVLMLAIFLVLSTGCVNPYVQKLKTYEMQIAEGRDRMFFDSMEMLKIERLDVEDQFARQGLETSMLISAFVRATGKTPEDLKASKAFSYDEVLKIVQDREDANKKRKAEIRVAFDNFTKKIKEQDDKVKAINEGVKKAEEVRAETYQEIGKTLLIGVGSAATAAALVQ